METLTREQAIKRIRDIQGNESCEHLDTYNTKLLPVRCAHQHIGAIQELMAIFDIKEEEI